MSTLRKRKLQENEASADMSDCALEIQTFLNGGLGGFERLRNTWRNVKDYYHKGDDESWQLACEQALAAYGVDAKNDLAEVGYELDRLPWDFLICSKMHWNENEDDE